MSADHPIVLVVDDDPEFRTHLAEALADTYDVLEAGTGAEALKQVDAADVMLLDRRLPDLRGRQVLTRVRTRDNPLPVAMVTAVEPDHDIVTMGFDTYLRKPVTPEEARSVVRSLLRRATYDMQIREYYSVVSKMAALEVEKSSEALERSEEYQSLKSRLENTGEQVQAILDETIERGEVTQLFATLGE